MQRSIREIIGCSGWKCCAALAALLGVAAPVQADHENPTHTYYSSRTQVSAAPAGMVTIGIDYDGNGTFETFEYIYPSDLEQAKRMSTERAATPREFGIVGQPGLREVRGEITGMQTVRITGMREDRLIAKVETPSGRVARVDMGPESGVAHLNLDMGDRVTVFGMKARVNNRPMLLARFVEADGQTVAIDQPIGTSGTTVTERTYNFSGPPNVAVTGKRFEAEVLNVFTKYCDEHNHDHLVATVRLEDGYTATVDLGAKMDLLQVDLDPGDDIEVVGNFATIDGKTVLLASELEADGLEFNIDRHPGEQKYFFRAKFSTDP